MEENEAYNNSGMSILLFSGELYKALAAFIIANGSAAMEIPVTIFFTFWGINVLRKDGPIKLKSKKTFIEKMFGWMMLKGPDKLTLSKMNILGLGTKLLKSEMEKKNVLSLPQLIKEAKEQGVKLIACTMSMNIMRIKEEEIIEGVDYAGVASFVDIANKSKTTLFI